MLSKIVIGTCVFAVILTEVTSWTIDLPVARKFFFERSQQKHGDDNKIYFNHRPGLVPYDNIEPNSLHNSPHKDLDHVNYAHEYGYLSYMEKKVHGILDKGNLYLEGLRKAMEQYFKQLESCTRLERSRPPTNRTWVLESLSPQPLSPTESHVVSCEKVSRESEHVRRLASLIIWATNELQDIAYAQQYDKKTKESEESILLLQLAWALDELARLTGFEPDPSEFVSESTAATAPTATPPTYFNLPIPNDGPTNANCLKKKSAVPATVRCAVPVPDAVLQFLNISNSSSASNTSVTQNMTRMLTLFNNSNTGERSFGNMSLDEIRLQMLGCLSGSVADQSACVGFAAFLQFLNNTSQLQNLGPRQSRDADSSQLEILQASEQNSIIPLNKARNKRTADGNDPLREFAMFYGKYKTWTNSNPQTVGDNGGKSDSFDVKNDLTAVKIVQKRSIATPGVKIQIPEDPMQDLSSHAKHQPNVHYIKDTRQANEIKSYLEKIYLKDMDVAKDHFRKLNGLIKSIQKRSVHYQKLHRPRVPENPMQDISYYVKNKPGTNIRPDVINAARVRLGLQQIFERGNIEVIHRYGSNYIPGVQPLMQGAIASASDI